MSGIAEYVLVDSKTETTVVVTLSTAAINLFYREGLTPDDFGPAGSGMGPPKSPAEYQCGFDSQ